MIDSFNKKYVVKQITRQGKVYIEKFSTYRETLCCATNFRKIKHSEIIKGNEQLNRFDYW